MLVTPRLRLRPWTLHDAEAALVIYGDPEVSRYLNGRAIADLDAMRAQLERWIERNQIVPEGQGAFAALDHDGVVVGTGLLKPLPDAHGALTDDVEVGWHLARARWGQGYATEIGRCLIQHGLGALGLPAIHAVVDAPNVASMRVAHRLGMQHLGTTEAYYGVALEHFRIRATAPRALPT